MKAVILLSGGIDSTVCLATAIGYGYEIDALTVDYGQTHSRELIASTAVANYYEVKHTIVGVDPILFRGASALTGGAEIPDDHADNPDATYVPGRNAVLLSLAASRAEAIGAEVIIIGVNADDAGGYPDCRRGFIEAFRDVIQMGSLKKSWLLAPLINMQKIDVVREAKRIAVPVELTWSCYRGGIDPCGRCGACKLLEVKV